MNNLLIDDAYSTTRGLAGTALPAAAADAAGGLPISDAGGLDLDAQIKTDIDNIATKAASLTFTVANQIDANVIDWKGATAPAMTGDAFARLGAPAGPSVSADVAAVKAQTAAIETDTQDLQTQVGTDGAGLTNIPWNAAWDAEVQSECADAIAAAEPIDADVKKINGTTITGDGSATPWGPA